MPNELRSLTRQLVSDFEQGLATCIKTNANAFWSSAGSRLKTVSKQEDLTNSDGELEPTVGEKVNILNDFILLPRTKTMYQTSVIRSFSKGCKEGPPAWSPPWGARYITSGPEEPDACISSAAQLDWSSPAFRSDWPLLYPRTSDARNSVTRCRI